MENIEKLILDNFARIKDHIYFLAVGVERNRERLANIPHKEMGDIALLYALKSPMENGMDRWTAVNYKMLRMFGISEERLHNIAQENSLRDYPMLCFSVGDALKEAGAPIRLGGNDLYALTNSEQQLGAAVVFYPGVLEQLQKSFPEGYFVLPSSIHECLIFSKKDLYASGVELSRTVKDINISHVALDEQLSDYAHEYDAKKHTLVLPESVRKRMIKQQRKDQNNRTR